MCGPVKGKENGWWRCKGKKIKEGGHCPVRRGERKDKPIKEEKKERIRG